MTEFRPSGSLGNIPLVEHICPKFSGATYRSGHPSPDGEEFLVPMCGCRPDPGWWRTPSQAADERAQVLADFRATKQM